VTKPVVYNYPAASTTAVALAQTLAAAGSLILNGPMSTGGPGAGATRYVPFPLNYRQVTLSSGNDLSAVNFTISGTLAGTTVSATIAGPNNSTVNTGDLLFDSVTSIKSSAGTSGHNISAGISIIGYTAPWTYNPYATVASTSVLVSVSGDAGFVTVDFLKNFGKFYPPLGNQVLATTGIVIPDGSNTNFWLDVLSAQEINAGDNVFGYFNDTINYAQLQITGVDESNDFNGGLTLIIIQQGVT